MDDLKELNLDQWSGGLNTASRAWVIPTDKLRACKNLFIKSDGSLALRDGQANLTPDKTTKVQGFIRFSTASAARLVYASGGTVYSRNEGAGTETSIGSIHASNIADFTTFQDKLFISDGSSALQKWSGSGNLVGVGITAPATACTAADGGAGLLDSSISGYRPYRYYITYFAADGTESNPSPVSNELSITNKQASLSSIPTSADSQVTGRNIYRDGGALTQAKLVGTIADNTTTTFTDNTADIRVGTVQMSTSNDKPPSGLSSLIAFKGRLIAIDPAKPYAIRVSSERPEYWPEEPVDTAIDGGYIEPFDPDFDNEVVALGSVGSFVVVGRKRSIDILDGRDFDTYSMPKMADIGIAGPRAITRVGPGAWFYSSDGMIYELSESTPRPVALDVEDLLKAVPEQYRSLACCGYADQRFYISLPTTSGTAATVLCHDFRTGAWLDLSGDSFSASLFVTSTDSAGKLQLLFAGQDGYKDTTGSSFDGIVKFPTTDTVNLPIDFKTGDLEFGSPAAYKKIRRLRIVGSLTPASGQSVTITVTADSNTFSQAISSATSGGVIYSSRLPASLVGRRVSIRISGTVTAASIQGIILAWHQVRRAND